MKKPIKIMMYVLAAITVLTIFAAIVMLRAVSGDNLIYMNSRLGGIYAVSYRWVCLASVVLVLFWISLIVKKRKKITARLPKLKRRERKTAVAAEATTATTTPRE